MPSDATADGPPAFDDPFDGDDVEQRVFGTVLRTREPTAASTVAEAADCDPKTARKYLDWFAELGVVVRHDGHPTTYERNEAYFEWRRVNRLAADHTAAELRERVEELTTLIDEYEETYGAPTPAEVDALAAAESTTGQAVDAVYRDLGDWATARAERERHERARRQRAGADGEEGLG